MSTYSITAAVILISVFLMIIRQIKSEYAIAAGSVVCLILIGLSVSAIYPLIDFIIETEFSFAEPEYMRIVMKSVGVAIICTTAAEICRDSGENALAYGVETFCKCEITAMSLPLIKAVLELSKDIMQ